MNLRDAVRAMARGYPGGVDSLAPRLPSKTASTLNKELLGAPGFKLGVDDAAEISAMCYELGTPEAIEFATAFAAQMGCLFVPLPKSSKVSDEKVTTLVATRALAGHSRESAELLAKVCETLADSEVTDNELRAAYKEAAEVVKSVQALMGALAALNLADKAVA